MDSNIGRKLDGRYEITELIGVGGMADVYKATDLMENRVVAVKILKAEFSENEDFLRRFRNESKAIAVLSHPNIVKIYDVGFTDEIQFIVMEYIDGITLKELLEQQGVLRWKDALKFVVQILKALQHAHDKGIVHRDIKPQNIMLFPDGTIKVMDFGIARFSRIDGKTLSEKTFGSVHYISPEQAKGEMTDERSDIYSVGVLLYEMLTGRKPFDGDSPISIAVKHMQDTAVPPREIMPSIPESLEEIVLHAMERSPARRYQSAAEMINDISTFKVNPSIVFGYKSTPVEEQPARMFRQEPDDDDDDEYDKEYYDDEEDEDDDEDDGKKRSYIIPILLAVTVAVVMIAAGVIAYSVINSFTGPGTHNSNVLIENFVGQSYARVRQEYSDKLTFNIREEWNNDYPEGIIIEQSVTNKTVRTGFTLDLTVSKGPRMIEVPDMSKKTLSVATSELKSAGFLPVTKEVWDPTGDVPAGMIVKTEPEAGKLHAAGAEIVLFVSLGQLESQVKVPNVVGMAQDKAMKTLKENKLSVSVQEVKQEGNKGKVVEQSWPEGSFVDKGTEVTIYVSTGEVDPTEARIPIPMPEGVRGAYTVLVYRDGTVIETQKIDEAVTVAGSYVNITVKGKKQETITISVRNDSSNKTVNNYATFDINYDTGEIKLVGSAKTQELINITPTTPTTTTTKATETTPKEVVTTEPENPNPPEQPTLPPQPENPEQPAEQQPEQGGEGNV